MSDPPSFIARGDPAYRRTVSALFSAGFAIFSLLYCVQPLLPLFTDTFAVSAAVSSLSLSVTTGCLAVSILIAGSLAEAWSRKRVMTVSLCGASLLNLAAAFAPNWPTFVALRALEGLALGGVPAVAMAYLAEEMHPDTLGSALGLYVSGSAIGGLSGRVITGIVADLSSWRVALAVIAVLGFGACLGFTLLIPASRHFVPRRGLSLAQHLEIVAGVMRRPGLLPLVATGFLIMGSFVTVYNYAGYRLSAPPFGLNQSEIGLIFFVYLVGMAASAWCGALADRIGRGPIVLAGTILMIAGILLTLPNSIWAIIAGICVLTFGFFGAHAVASAWVGRIAGPAKAQAASLYLLAYYLGSSAIGSLAGKVYDDDGWTVLAGFVVVLLALELCLGARLLVLDRTGR